MADYQSHLNQAKKNLQILADVNKTIHNSWDWQVTLCYYVAVHLMNAHLAIKANLHYKTHVDVKNALFSSTSPCKIPEDIYLDFAKLENYSRRARYLCNDNPHNHDSDRAFLTYDKHLKKSLILLDRILKYFSIEYEESFDKESIKNI